VIQESPFFFLLPRYNKERITIGTGLSGVQLVVVIVKLLRYHRLLLLLSPTFWMEAEQVFRAADCTSVSNTAGLLVVCFGLEWGDKRETTTFLRGASEKYLIISFFNMNGTSLCVKFTYTKVLLYALLFYTFSYRAFSNLHPFLIYALSFAIQRPSAGSLLREVLFNPD
jgi:hypothetical protein